MSIYQVTDKNTIAPLYVGWEETMIWSCLQDCMGVAFAEDRLRPRSAQIVIGPFSFFAGEVNRELIEHHMDYAFDMIPQNQLWAEAIEIVYGEMVKEQMRYATKKDRAAFDVSRLKQIVASLPALYTLHRIDRPLYEEVMATPWAADLCANFPDAGSYLDHGLGFVVMKNDEIVSGASSFTYYRDGIEIEIDTREDERRRGLALACGARLILECLEHDLYPSWDAHNLGSLALAQKLGYTFAREYPTYEFV